MQKSEVIQTITEVIQDKRESLEAMIADLQESASQDTKSSMGDKYETSREMTKQEIIKLQAQLALISEQEVQLERMKTRAKRTSAGPGSLIETEQGIFFLGLALGKVETGGITVFCLSTASPFGKVLSGVETGDQISFRNKNIRVLNIW